MCFNTFTQYIKSENFQQLGFKFKANYEPRLWFQFADDASVISGAQHESILLNALFTRWCQWSMMIIRRVDKCKTFGMAKIGSQCKQYLPKLFLNNELVPQVKLEESFTYLGRHFNYAMDDAEHKSHVQERTNETLQDIDKLPLHPRHKIALYKSYLLSQISWDLTVANIGLTWVKNNLDNVASLYLRRWLEIPMNGTLDICLLSRTRFGLDLILPSTKLTQCQSVIRQRLKNSMNADIRAIYEDTSKGTNVQYDTSQSTRNVIKSIRKTKEDRVVQEQKSQGLVLSFLLTDVLSSTIKLWSIAQSALPRYIFNFTVSYLNNSLPTSENMVNWGQSNNSSCSACAETETLLHVVAGCKAYLRETRYDWRHNSVLLFLTKTFIKIKGVEIYSDLDDYRSPSIITGELLRPDLLIISKEVLYVLELTVGFETNLCNNWVRKQNKYKDLIVSLSQSYEDVKFINLSMGALGVYNKSCNSFFSMMDELKLSKVEKKYIARTTTNLAIRCSYYIFS